MGTEKIPIPAGVSAGGVRVIPLDAKDRWRPIDNIRSNLFFVFRDTALDAVAMRQALDRFIRNHLPILGARIAETKGEPGLLEYHLPTPFPADYALFQWSDKAIDSTLEAAHLLPTETPSRKGPFFGPASVPELESQWIPTDWPLERKFEKPNTPLLLVHITSYTDAAILSLSLPHAVADQMGYASMIRAWMQVVAGQEPAPFLELKPGALDGKKNLSQKELRRRKSYRIMNKAERTAMIMSFIPELVINRAEIRRVLFLPATLVDSLRDRYNDDLRAKHGEDTACMTNGDVISALLAKLGYLGKTSSKMVTLSSTINCRGRHPTLPADRPYLHNCVTHAITRMPINRTTSLCELAYRHRLAVRKGMEVESIERDLAVLHEMCRRRYIFHICEPGELSYSITNWCGAWRGIDFSPAVMKSEKATVGVSPASAAPLVFGHSLERHVPTRFSSEVMCKADGGYWCDLATSKKTMALVEKLFESDPQLLTM